MVRLWSVCALSVAIGAGVGWALHGSSSADTNEAQATTPVAQLVPSRPQPAGPSGLDLAQLHAAIREELAAASMGQAANKPSATTAAKEDVPASRELVAQRREAMQDIQTLMASGEWGDKERTEFQQKFAVLDPEQARQALQQIMKGLNNGSIQALTNVPL